MGFGVFKGRAAASLALPVCMVLLAACGSTVQSSGRFSDGAGTDELSGPLGDGGSGQPGLDGGPDGTAFGPNGTGTGPGGGPGGPGTNGPGPTTPGPGGPVTGRGFTADKIFIGFPTATNGSQALGGIGVRTGSTADFKRMAEAMADDVNRRGGLVGRRVEIVIHDIDVPAYLQDPQRELEAACRRWTEDRPVFAVAYQVPEPPLESLIACLAGRQTPLVTTSGLTGITPQRIFARYSPYLYSPNTPAQERLVRSMLQRAAATGYFDAWDPVTGAPGALPAKVGILSNRSFWGNDFVATVTSELQRLGHSVASTFEASGQTGNIATEMTNAIVRFRNDDVTHLVMHGTLAQWFMASAEPQRFRPRYLLSTASNPRGVRGQAADAQLAGAMGIGYRPGTDVDASQDPGMVSEAEARCLAFMQEKAGQNTADWRVRAAANEVCDNLTFLFQAIERGGLGQRGLSQGVNGNLSLQPSSTFVIGFPGGRPDGAAAARDLAYKTECKCFGYRSATNHAL